MRTDPTTAQATTSRTMQFLASVGRAGKDFSAQLDAARQRLASLSAPLGPVPQGTEALRRLVDQAARTIGVEPALLHAVVAVESGFNPYAVSRAGAKGLTQLMDGTARALGVHDPFDPWQNLLGGARYLKGLLTRYRGDLHLALAAYNAGPGAVDRFGGIPPYQETQRYVAKVSQALQHFRSTQRHGGLVDV